MFCVSGSENGLVPRNVSFSGLVLAPATAPEAAVVAVRVHALQRRPRSGCRRTAPGSAGSGQQFLRFIS